MTNKERKKKLIDVLAYLSANWKIFSSQLKDGYNGTQKVTSFAMSPLAA